MAWERIAARPRSSEPRGLGELGCLEVAWNPPFVPAGLTRRHDLREPALDCLARDRARVHYAHDALRVDENRGWHAVERVSLARLALVIEQHGKRQLQLVDELPDVLHLLLIGQVDRQHFEAGSVVCVVRRNDIGHLPAARSAPGGPEVDKQGTTRVIGEARRCAGDPSVWADSDPAAVRSVANAIEKSCEPSSTLVPQSKTPSSPIGSSASAALPRTRLPQHSPRAEPCQDRGAHSVARYRSHWAFSSRMKVMKFGSSRMLARFGSFAKYG